MRRIIVIALVAIFMFNNRLEGQIIYSLQNDASLKKSIRENSTERVILSHFDSLENKTGETNLLFDKNGNLTQYGDEAKYEYENNLLTKVISEKYDRIFNLRYDTLGKLLEIKISQKKPFSQSGYEFLTYSMDERGELDLFIENLPKKDKEIMIEKLWYKKGSGLFLKPTRRVKIKYIKK